MVAFEKPNTKSKSWLILMSVIFVIALIMFVFIPILKQTGLDDQFPDTNGYAPAELYPNQQPATECRQDSTLMYVSHLAPITSFCNSNQNTQCTFIDYVGYTENQGIRRDGQLLQANAPYEDANVKITPLGVNGAYITDSKNYFNIISDFQCDTSGLFEDANNIIECSFTSTRSQNVDVMAFIGRQGSDEITDLRNLKRTYTLQLGQNNMNFQVPIDLIEDENYYLFVTMLDPKKWESSRLIGSQIQCVFNQQMQIMKLEKLPFTIMPKPIYFNKQPNQQCPIGYSESETASTLCIRDDLKDLPCFKLKSPITVNYTYACGSDGQFVQIVYVPQNCPSNPCQTGFTCEVTSGTCIASQIYDEIFNQCQSATDCPNLCSNIGSSQIECNNNRCEYDNVCTVDYERLVEILKKSDKYPEDIGDNQKTLYLLIGGGVVFLIVLFMKYSGSKWLKTN